MLTGNGFNHQFEELNLIAGAQNIIILKVNLVLTDCTLMVAGFYFKAHLSQDIYNLAASIVCQVCRCQVKITTLIIDFQSWITMLIHLEEEKFWFRAQVEGRKTKVIHMLQGFFQIGTRIPSKRFPFCRIDITNQTRYSPILNKKRKNRPSIQIRIEIHI